MALRHSRYFLNGRCVIVPSLRPTLADKPDVQRILYVGMRADYGDTARGLSFEEQNFHSALRNFPGVQVEHFDFMAVGQRLGQQLMGKALRQCVERFRPHLLFFVGFDKANDPPHEVLADITRNTQTATMLWICDDHWRFEDYSGGWAQVMDWMVTTDHSAVAKYQQIGCGDKVILSQWAVNPHLYRPVYGPFAYDVSFVGQPHGDRPRILQGLLDAGIRVAVFGHGWGPQIRRLPFEAMVETFSRSRINLNLANSSAHDSQQIKGRNFEVPGCHGFLLTQPAPHIEEYFEPGREIALFEDESELLPRIRYFLSHEEERRCIATRGFARCVGEHTWEHRFARIFERIGLFEGEAKSRRRTMEAAWSSI